MSEVLRLARPGENLLEVYYPVSPKEVVKGWRVSEAGGESPGVVIRRIRKGSKLFKKLLKRVEEDIHPYEANLLSREPYIIEVRRYDPSTGRFTTVDITTLKSFTEEYQPPCSPNLIWPPDWPIKW